MIHFTMSIFELVFTFFFYVFFIPLLVISLFLALVAFWDGGYFSDPLPLNKYKKAEPQKIIDIKEEKGQLSFYDGKTKLKSVPSDAEIQVMLDEIIRAIPTAGQVGYRLPNGKVLNKDN